MNAPVRRPYANVRQPPISTLNLAHMIPFSAVWAGPERDEHFAAPPLLFGKTEGSTPFRFSLHVGDVGHTLVVGPTGAGKSVLLALMALQFRRYAGAQVFAFDFGGSIRAAALAMGGDWHDLGGGLTESSETSVSLQPLAGVGDLAERGWAAGWIAAILKREPAAQMQPSIVRHDVLEEQLRRCSLAGEVGAQDPQCLKAWADNRRRFLGSPPTDRPEVR